MDQSISSDDRKIVTMEIPDQLQENMTYAIVDPEVLSADNNNVYYYINVVDQSGQYVLPNPSEINNSTDNFHETELVSHVETVQTFTDSHGQTLAMHQPDETLPDPEIDLALKYLHEPEKDDFPIEILYNAVSNDSPEDTGMPKRKKRNTKHSQSKSSTSSSGLDTSLTSKKRTGAFKETPTVQAKNINIVPPLSVGEVIFGPICLTAITRRGTHYVLVGEIVQRAIIPLTLPRLLKYVFELSINIIYATDDEINYLRMSGRMSLNARNKMIISIADLWYLVRHLLNTNCIKQQLINDMKHICFEKPVIHNSLRHDASQSGNSDIPDWVKEEGESRYPEDTDQPDNNLSVPNLDGSTMTNASLHVVNMQKLIAKRHIPSTEVVMSHSVVTQKPEQSSGGINEYIQRSILANDSSSSQLGMLGAQMHDRQVYREPIRKSSPPATNSNTNLPNHTMPVHLDVHKASQNMSTFTDTVPSSITPIQLAEPSVLGAYSPDRPVMLRSEVVIKPGKYKLSDLQSVLGLLKRQGVEVDHVPYSASRNEKVTTFAEKIPISNKKASTCQRVPPTSTSCKTQLSLPHDVKEVKSFVSKTHISDIKIKLFAPSSHCDVNIKDDCKTIIQETKDIEVHIDMPAGDVDVDKLMNSVVEMSLLENVAEPNFPLEASVHTATELQVYEGAKSEDTRSEDTRSEVQDTISEVQEASSELQDTSEIQDVRSEDARTPRSEPQDTSEILETSSELQDIMNEAPSSGMVSTSVLFKKSPRKSHSPRRINFPIQLDQHHHSNNTKSVISDTSKSKESASKKQSPIKKGIFTTPPSSPSLDRRTRSGRLLNSSVQKNSKKLSASRKSRSRSLPTKRASRPDSVQSYQSELQPAVSLSLLTQLGIEDQNTTISMLFDRLAHLHKEANHNVSLQMLAEVAAEVVNVEKKQDSSIDPPASRAIEQVNKDHVTKTTSAECDDDESTTGNTDNEYNDDDDSISDLPCGPNLDNTDANMDGDPKDDAQGPETLPNVLAKCTKETEPAISPPFSNPAKEMEIVTEDRLQNIDLIAHKAAPVCSAHQAKEQLRQIFASLFPVKVEQGLTGYPSFKICFPKDPDLQFTLEEKTKLMKFLASEAHHNHILKSDNPVQDKLLCNKSEVKEEPGPCEPSIESNSQPKRQRKSAFRIISKSDSQPIPANTVNDKCGASTITHSDPLKNSSSMIVGGALTKRVSKRKKLCDCCHGNSDHGSGDNGNGEHRSGIVLMTTLNTNREKHRIDASGDTNLCSDIKANTDAMATVATCRINKQELSLFQRQLNKSGQIRRRPGRPKRDSPLLKSNVENAGHVLNACATVIPPSTPQQLGQHGTSFLTLPNDSTQHQHRTDDCVNGNLTSYACRNTSATATNSGSKEKYNKFRQIRRKPGRPKKDSASEALLNSLSATYSSMSQLNSSSVTKATPNSSNREKNRIDSTGDENVGSHMFGNTVDLATVAGCKEKFSKSGKIPRKPGRPKRERPDNALLQCSVENAGSSLIAGATFTSASTPQQVRKRGRPRRL